MIRVIYYSVSWPNSIIILVVVEVMILLRCTQLTGTKKRNAVDWNDVDCLCHVKDYDR